MRFNGANLCLSITSREQGYHLLHLIGHIKIITPDNQQFDSRLMKRYRRTLVIIKWMSQEQRLALLGM